MVSPTKPDEGHVLFWITEEDGREFATCAAADFRAAMTERDQLRAEIETLRLGLRVGDQRYAELGTENERLRAGWDEAQTFMQLSLEREERLRAALTEITELDLEGDASLDDALAIADEALNPPPA